MMSPRPIADDRGSGQFRQTPLQIIHIFGNFLRIWSVYSMYTYLTQTGASVVLFIFSCLVPASIILLLMQTPWKGRPLSNTQVVPSIINGGVTALYFILWGKGLKGCGPVRTLLAEYSGAVLGVLSAVLYGQGHNIWKKVGGLIAMMVSFYLLSKGWAMARYFPFKFGDNTPSDSEIVTEEVLGMNQMVLPILAGILSAFRRVISRRVSLKSQLKRRLHALTIASATCFLFPVAMWDTIIGSTSSSSLTFSPWVYGSTIFFGIVLIFYIESIAEERLHMVFSSPRHLAVAGACIVVMEIFYKMDFSFPGFLLCCLILGFGIYEATALERGRRETFQKSDLADDILGDQLHMSPLPT